MQKRPTILRNPHCNIEEMLLFYTPVAGALHAHTHTQTHTHTLTLTLTHTHISSAAAAAAAPVAGDMLMLEGGDI